MQLMEGMPEGEKIVYFSSTDDDKRKEKLGAMLRELVKDQGIDHSRIAILGGHSMENTCIGESTTIGDIRITDDIEDQSDAIHYYTYMKFKGCEADVVILLDVDRDDQRWSQRALYTAISRARHLLYVIWAGEKAG